VTATSKELSPTVPFGSISGKGPISTCFKAPGCHTPCFDLPDSCKSGDREKTSAFSAIVPYALARLGKEREASCLEQKRTYNAFSGR
jgi:hypothetical protein